MTARFELFDQYGQMRTEFTEAELAQLSPEQRTLLERVQKVQIAIRDRNDVIARANQNIQRLNREYDLAVMHQHRDVPKPDPVTAIKDVIAARRRATFGPIADQ